MTVRTLMYKLRDLVDEGWGEVEVYGLGEIEDAWKCINEDGVQSVILSFRSLEGEDDND